MNYLSFLLKTKKGLLYSCAFLTVLTTLLACSQHEQHTPTPDGSKATISAAEYGAMRASFSALEGDWLLTTYALAPLPQHLQNQSSIRFTKESPEILKVVGNGFVNGYGGTFRLDEAEGLILLMEGIAQELKASTNEELNQAEEHYFKALAKARTFDITDSGQLKLYLGEKGDSTTEVMVFTKK